MASLTLTDTRRGAWIVITQRHLKNFDDSSPSFSSFENIVFAGKCGNLLIKIAGDDEELLSIDKLKVHARLCGISARELDIYIKSLKQFGCIDSDKEGKQYNVLALTSRQVLKAVNDIFKSSAIASTIEKNLCNILEYCISRPRLDIELKQFLSTLGVADGEIENIISILESFELVGCTELLDKNQKVYFNVKQFEDNISISAKAISFMSKEDRSNLNNIIETVNKYPGTPLESIAVPQSIKEFAVKVGLVDGSEVSSPVGKAIFLTMPRLAEPSVGKETSSSIEQDAFHHAKMLLSSIRFGQHKSNLSRGKIVSPHLIIDRLLERDRIGPCTAIGEDYIILEGEGVIKTIKDRHNSDRFYMQLKKREPAQIVKQLIYNGTMEASSEYISGVADIPITYKGPESLRTAIKKTAHDPEAIKKFIEALRT